MFHRWNRRLDFSCFRDRVSMDFDHVQPALLINRIALMVSLDVINQTLEQPIDDVMNRT